MTTRLLLALTAAGLLAGCATPTKTAFAPACDGTRTHVVTVTTQGARLALRPGWTGRLHKVSSVAGEGGVVLSCKPSGGGLKACLVLFEDVPGKGNGAQAKAYAERVVYPADEDSPSVEVRVQFTPRAAPALNCS